MRPLGARFYNTMNPWWAIQKIKVPSSGDVIILTGQVTLCITAWCITWNIYSYAKRMNGHFSTTRGRYFTLQLTSNHILEMLSVTVISTVLQLVSDCLDIICVWGGRGVCYRFFKQQFMAHSGYNTLRLRVKITYLGRGGVPYNHYLSITLHAQKMFEFGSNIYYICTALSLYSPCVQV